MHLRATKTDNAEAPDRAVGALDAAHSND